VRILKQEESSRLNSLYPGLPTSLAQCPTCAGTKWFRWYDDYNSPTSKNIVDYDCTCSDQFILFKYFLNAGIGKQGQRLALGDAVGADAKALQMISDYLENSGYYVNRGMGLLFHGTHGSGKTMLTTILIKQLLAEGVDGYFTTFNNLLDNFASGWRDDENRKWFEKRVRNAPLLVIDDIGKENKNLNNMATNAVDGVLRSRVQNSLPTIITTNLSLNEFERSYSSGVMSLVSETSLTHEFQGDDWRPNQRERNQREAQLMLSRPIVVS
jgi:DNA replication protein DnaC